MSAGPLHRQGDITGPFAAAGPPPEAKPCRHDSTRADGTLDAHCLRCGSDGYWHDGHAHFKVHPSGKVLIRLACDDGGTDA